MENGVTDVGREKTRVNPVVLGYNGGYWCELMVCKNSYRNKYDINIRQCVCVCVCVCVCGYTWIPALSAGEVWELQHLNSNEHTWCLDIGF